MTAKKEYDKKHAEIGRLIARLEKSLENHASKFNADSKNWGYVGDLGRIEKLLEEAIGGE